MERAVAASLIAQLCEDDEEKLCASFPSLRRRISSLSAFRRCRTEHRLLEQLAKRVTSWVASDSRALQWLGVSNMLLSVRELPVDVLNVHWFGWAQGLSAILQKENEIVLHSLAVHGIAALLEACDTSGSLRNDIRSRGIRWTVNLQVAPRADTFLSWGLKYALTAIRDESGPVATYKSIHALLTVYITRYGSLLRAVWWSLVLGLGACIERDSSCAAMLTPLWAQCLLQCRIGNETCTIEEIGFTTTGVSSISPVHLVVEHCVWWANQCLDSLPSDNRPDGAKSPAQREPGGNSLFDGWKVAPSFDQQMRRLYTCVRLVVAAVSASRSIAPLSPSAHQRHVLSVPVRSEKVASRPDISQVGDESVSGAESKAAPEGGHSSELYRLMCQSAGSGSRVRNAGSSMLTMGTGARLDAHVHLLGPHMLFAPWADVLRLAQRLWAVRAPSGQAARVLPAQALFRSLSLTLARSLLIRLPCHWNVRLGLVQWLASDAVVNEGLASSAFDADQLLYGFPGAAVRSQLYLLLAAFVLKHGIAALLDWNDSSEASTETAVQLRTQLSLVITHALRDLSWPVSLQLCFLQRSFVTPAACTRCQDASAHAGVKRRRTGSGTSVSNVAQPCGCVQELLRIPESMWMVCRHATLLLSSLCWSCDSRSLWGLSAPSSSGTRTPSPRGSWQAALGRRLTRLLFTAQVCRLVWRPAALLSTQHDQLWAQWVRQVVGVWRLVGTSRRTGAADVLFADLEDAGSNRILRGVTGASLLAHKSWGNPISQSNQAIDTNHAEATDPTALLWRSVSLLLRPRSSPSAGPSAMDESVAAVENSETAATIAPIKESVVETKTMELDMEWKASAERLPEVAHEEVSTHAGAPQQVGLLDDDSGPDDADIGTEGLSAWQTL